jgi:hypothetical protein
VAESDHGDDRSPEEQFQELIRQLFGGAGAQVDPEQLAQLSGMGIDPAMMQTVMQHLQGAFAAGADEGISWDLAKRQALHIANQDGLGVTAGQRTDLDQAFALAALWLSEATTISELASAPRALTRGGWVEATLPVWQELAEPVATSIADALTSALREQAPEEMQSLVQGAGRLMRTVGGSLFASQLGQVVGNLSKEVVSGGDVGIPLLADGDAVILPQNFSDFGRDLEIPDDQLALYIATRELAHARLFRHARWLRLHVISQVTASTRTRSKSSRPVSTRPSRRSCAARWRAVLCCRSGRRRRMPRWCAWRTCSRRSRAGWRWSPRRRPRGSPRPTASPRPSAGAVPWADPPSRLWARWSGWSCAPGACAKPRRCGGR